MAFQAGAFQSGAFQLEIAARGPDTVATLLIDAEGGSSVTYSWATNILPMRDGGERRLALCGTPRETYAFTALLSDGQLADLQSKLVARAAQGGVFAVGLWHEALLLTADGSSGTLTVPTTDYADWAYAGQAVAVVGPDGTLATGVIQAFTSTSIVLNAPIGAAGARGGWVMPTIPCYLDDTQTLGIYPVNAGRYELKARAVYFGNVDGEWDPRGASVTTYTDPVTAKVYAVWDRGTDVDETSPRASVAGTELTDRGGALLLTPRQTTVDFSSEINVHLANGDEEARQHLKAFHGAVRGRQRSFLLPTWKPDLIAIGDASGGALIVEGPPLDGVADYAEQWFQSSAHRRIQILLDDGTVAYRNVTDAANNDMGETRLVLDSGVVGTIARVSFLELVRLDTDDIVVTYDEDGVGVCRMPVITVQE